MQYKGINVSCYVADNKDRFTGGCKNTGYSNQPCSGSAYIVEDTVCDRIRYVCAKHAECGCCYSMKTKIITKWDSNSYYRYLRCSSHRPIFGVAAFAGGAAGGAAIVLSFGLLAPHVVAVATAAVAAGAVLMPTQSMHATYHIIKLCWDMTNFFTSTTLTGNINGLNSVTNDISWFNTNTM